ncbi:hypothetical protein [Phenylobacterium sp.]|uniref:hypothetical protein n=1 Tax=Phenylobacterium sp. TaxID=1871053 RepID=UPI002FC8FF6E
MTTLRDNQQLTMAVVAILIERLGGSVMITDAELRATKVTLHSQVIDCDLHLETHPLTEDDDLATMRPAGRA